MWGYDHMWGMHWGWWIFWIVLILGLVWLVRGRLAPPATREPRESALDVLQRRYANGDLTTEEYEERKARLEEKR